MLSGYEENPPQSADWIHPSGPDRGSCSEELAPLAAQPCGDHRGGGQESGRRFPWCGPSSSLVYHNSPFTPPLRRAEK
ncbi:MAG: hypothetical protein ACETVR_04715 [Candidatus Bathyarchaeia archaeon]